MMFRSIRRTAVVLPAVLPLIFASASVADDYEAWKSRQGGSIEAKFVDLREDSVRLVDRERRPRVVPLDALHPSSRSRALECWYDGRDREQFRMVRQHLAGINQRPEATSRILQGIHDAFPESPYAGLWASVGYSAGINDLRLAKRLLTQTIERLEAQRDALPGRHATTLASAYNNYALICLKETGATACAGQLVLATEQTPLMPPTVRHNAEQLLNLSTRGGARTELSVAKRTALTQAIARAEVNTVGGGDAAGWLYTLDVDVPRDEHGSARRISGIDPPHTVMEVVSTGTGVVVAPGIVVTARRVLEPDSGRRPAHVTVATGQSGQWKSLAVKTCMRTATRTVATGGTLIQTSWGDSLMLTHFKFLPPRPGSIEAELVALHVPGLNLKPIPVARQPVAEGVETWLIGFRRGPDMLDAGRVRLIGTADAGREDRLRRTSHEIGGGQFGSPLLDDGGNVLGLIAGLSPTAARGGCQFFDGRVVHHWFANNVPTSALKTPAPGGGGRVEDSESSIVPIIAWGAKPSMTLQAQMSDGTAAGESLQIRDGWCMSCGGSGNFPCGCRNGTVSVKQRKQVSYSALSGPVYGTVTKAKRCGDCRGRGFHDCPHCRDGKY